jgi:hypothetical protein
MLACVRLRDPAGATRRRMAIDLIDDLETIDATLKAVKAVRRFAVRCNGSTLMDLFGIGPARPWVLSGAASRSGRLAGVRSRLAVGIGSACQ